MRRLHPTRYTVGVWVGNADGAPMWDVSGVTGAAPVWAALINYLHRRVASREPAAPAGVVRTRIAYQDRIEPSRDDWFLRGTQMTNIGLSAAASAAAVDASGSKGAAKIGAPTDGTIFALDPDIPASAQRVWFESAGGAAGVECLATRRQAAFARRARRVAAVAWSSHARTRRCEGGRARQGRFRSARGVCPCIGFGFGFGIAIEAAAQCVTIRQFALESGAMTPE